MTLDDFFAGWSESRRLFDALDAAVAEVAPAEVRVSKSQVAFYHGRAFAWAWLPGRYLRGKVAPLVLSVTLRRREPSLRWKEIVEPAPGRFMHHLELYAVTDIDDEVRAWLREAWLLTQDRDPAQETRP